MSDKYFLDVACGFVPGRFNVNVFGFVRSAQTTDTPFTLWGPKTLYEFPANVESWEVVSDSPDDTLGGSGAQFVAIDALGADYGIIDQIIVPLNGTTPVLVPGGAVFYRINNFFALCPAPSTQGINFGTISLRAVGTGLLRHVINPEQGQATGFFYTVPAGHTLWLANFLFITGKPGGGAATWTHEFRVIMPNFTNLVTSSVTFITGGIPTTVPAGFAIPEKFSIEVRAIDVSSNGLDMAVLASGILTKLDASAVVQRAPTAFTNY